jgi:hypothetical protein
LATSSETRASSPSPDTSGLTSLDTSIDLGLLEGLTEATTRATPDARAALSPLRIGDDRPHDVSAGPGESTGGDAVVPGPLSALVSGLGLSAFGVSADADEDGAIATIAAVDATLDALNLTSLDIGLTGVVSEVTRTGSSAEQDLTVDGLDIALGDILPADLLAALPLDALLDLITELGDAGLLPGVGGLRTRSRDWSATSRTRLDPAPSTRELGDVDLDGDLSTSSSTCCGSLGRASCRPRPGHRGSRWPRIGRRSRTCWAQPFLGSDVDDLARGSSR